MKVYIIIVVSFEFQIEVAGVYITLKAAEKKQTELLKENNMSVLLHEKEAQDEISD